MKQKLYYIKNETAEKAIYKNFEKQRFSVIEKDSEPPMVLSFFDDKNVTDEYEYVYIHQSHFYHRKTIVLLEVRCLFL